MLLKDFNIQYIKGKPPRQVKGDILLPYLNPDYLRNESIPEFYPIQPGIVTINDDDLILLWDGSNAGEFLLGKKGILASTMVKLVCTHGLNNKYFYYSLKFQEPSLKSRTAGSGIPHVDKEVLFGLPIYFPEENQQTIIVKILTAVDNAINKASQLISKYECIKTGLMQDLLTCGIDEDGNIRSEDTHEFKDSPLGRIPKNWNVVNVGTISEHIGSGITPRGGSNVYQTSGIMLLRSQNVYADGMRLDDVAYISEAINDTMIRSEIFEYDVLLNITGASIGRCTYVPAKFPRANVNQHVCAIRLGGKNFSKSLFLSEFLNSEPGQNQIFKYNAGSNREGLNYSQIRGIELCIPNDDDELERIAEVLNCLRQYMDNLKLEHHKYISLKAALMQDLLTGKVHVDALMEQNAESV